jgi:hypothetical protein
MTRNNANFNKRDHYDVGTLPPAGYVAWHYWAEDQHKGGLRQRQCKTCGLWKFPQEACRHETEVA